MTVREQDQGETSEHALNLCRTYASSALGLLLWATPSKRFGQGIQRGSQLRTSIIVAAILQAPPAR